jgi:hypothetical protein
MNPLDSISQSQKQLDTFKKNLEKLEAKEGLQDLVNKYLLDDPALTPAEADQWANIDWNRRITSTKMQIDSLNSAISAMQALFNQIQ